MREKQTTVYLCTAVEQDAAAAISSAAALLYLERELTACGFRVQLGNGDPLPTGECHLALQLATTFGGVGCVVYHPIQPEIVTMVIPMILGIYIVIDGGVNVRRSFEMKELEFSRWWAAMVVAALMILLGLVMFLNPFAAAQVTVMFIGVVLIYQGVSDFIILMLIGVWKRRLENRLEEQGGR